MRPCLSGAAAAPRSPRRAVAVRRPAPLTPHVWRVRTFANGDADALAKLFHLAVRATPPGEYTPRQLAAWSPAPAPARRFVERAATHLILVAVDAADAPVGFATLEGDGHLDHLYRHPAQTARGVGPALCAAIETAARGRGIASLFTEASAAARPALLRLGWRLGARRDFVLGDTPIHNWRMTKRLD